MLENIFDNIQRTDLLERRLRSLFEGKSWEHIAYVLYQILDDIDTASDVCREDLHGFQSIVRKLQAKKNAYLYSPDRHSLALVDEAVADRVWDFLRRNPNSTFNEVLDGIDATGEDVGKFEDTVKDMLDKSIYVEDGKYSIVECVCHIYGLNNHELQEFYSGMGDGWNAINEPYGSDKAEVEAELKKRGLIVEAISNLQQKLKDYYKDRLNTRLKNSTFGKENYPKFWMLVDGTIVPVDHTHLATAHKAGLSIDQVNDLEDEDAIGGYIEGMELGLPLSINQELTSAQKVTVKKLYNDYPFNHILTGPLGGDSIHVPSSRDLSRFLASGEYRGKKAWEESIEDSNRLEEWVFAVIENVKEALELGEIEKDKWEVLDYLKTNYRANNLTDAYDKMEQAVWDWYVSEVRESLCENLCAFAKKELGLAGLFDKDSDYDGMLGEAVMELMQVFADQGHSGFSAGLTMAIFDKLAAWKPLTELTDNADEWNDVSEYGSGSPQYQSSRSPACFSDDKGKTYWDIEEDYFYHTDEDGSRWSGGLSEEEWENRPMYTSKHFEEKEE